MKNNCQYVPFSDAFVHGELNEDEHSRFKSHLEICKECRIEVESLNRLADTLKLSYTADLDENFNYGILRNLRNQELAGERKEIRIAFEDIVISLATLLVIVILGLQAFDRPSVSPIEMVGQLTSFEKSSLDQENLSNDQVLELVLRSK